MLLRDVIDLEATANSDSPEAAAAAGNGARLPLADPALRARIHRFDAARDVAAKLAYVTFLGNAHPLMPYLARRRLPFILQLYPGGGMAVDQPETDERLRRVLLSPLCRKVIVTQTITRDYIIDRIGIDPAKVEFIFGGVFESRIGFDFTRDKRRFPRDKATLDLCFVAHKYGDDLTSKGYDRFVAFARALAPRFPELRFHVVGDYQAEDIPLGEALADGRFTYHGRQPSSFFEGFYPGMDAIVSANRPFVLAPGAYDGFPTGACIEAGFRGVLNCIGDPLRLNRGTFEDGRDLVLLDEDDGRSVERLGALLAEPERLYGLAYANWRRFHEVLGTDRQLWARSRLITAELLRSDVLVAAPGPWAATEISATEASLRSEVRRLEDSYRQLEAAYRLLVTADRAISMLRKVPGYRTAGRAYRRLHRAASRFMR